MGERLLAARDLGDLKENAEYHIAKDDQAHLETRIKRLRMRLRDAVVVEESDAATFAFGRTAEVRRGGHRQRAHLDDRGPAPRPTSVRGSCPWSPRWPVGCSATPPATWSRCRLPAGRGSTGSRSSFPDRRKAHRAAAVGSTGARRGRRRGAVARRAGPGPARGSPGGSRAHHGPDGGGRRPCADRSVAADHVAQPGHAASGAQRGLSVVARADGTAALHPIHPAAGAGGCVSRRRGARRRGDRAGPRRRGAAHPRRATRPRCRDRSCGRRVRRSCTSSGWRRCAG